MGKRNSGGMTTFKQQVRRCTKRTASFHPFQSQLAICLLLCFLHPAHFMNLDDLSAANLLWIEAPCQHGEL